MLGGGFIGLRELFKYFFNCFCFDFNIGVIDGVEYMVLIVIVIVVYFNWDFVLLGKFDCIGN